MEIFWYLAIVGAVGHLVANDEAHDAICCGKVEVSGHAAFVKHGNVLALIAGKVDDDLVTLAIGNCEMICVDWMGEKTRIRCNDIKFYCLVAFILYQGQIESYSY